MQYLENIPFQLQNYDIVNLGFLFSGTFDLLSPGEAPEIAHEYKKKTSAITTTLRPTELANIFFSTYQVVVSHPFLEFSSP